MKVEINTTEDEFFRLNPKKSPVSEEKTEEPIQVQPPVSKRPEPTLENKKGHEWFNGTSWGLK